MKEKPCSCCGEIREVEFETELCEQCWHETHQLLETTCPIRVKVSCV